jgi:hypothetical protein
MGKAQYLTVVTATFTCHVAVTSAGLRQAYGDRSVLGAVSRAGVVACCSGGMPFQGPALPADCRRLLQMPARDLSHPGVAMAGWLRKRSDWLGLWNRRWMVLCPFSEGNTGALGWWLFTFDSPSSSAARRVTALKPGCFEVDATKLGEGNGSLSTKGVGSSMAYVEIFVHDSASSTVLPTKQEKDGRVTMRLQHESQDEMLSWLRSLQDISCPGTLSPTAKASVFARRTRYVPAAVPCFGCAPPCA